MEKISVNTSLGVLAACIGGDPKFYPEIFVYLQREDGVEIDLVAADVNLENKTAYAYLYGDTSTESYTRHHTWTENEINVDYDSGGAEKW